MYRSPFCATLSWTLFVAVTFAGIHVEAAGSPVVAKQSLGSRILGHFPKGMQKRLLMRKVRRDPAIGRDVRGVARSLLKTAYSARRFAIPVAIGGAALITAAMFAPELFMASGKVFAFSGASMLVHAGLPLVGAYQNFKRAKSVRFKATVIEGLRDADRLGLDVRERSLLADMSAKLAAREK